MLGAKEVIAIDISKNYLKSTIELCKEKIINKMNKLRSYRADLEDLPFINDYFDFVFCSEVIEHLNNPQQALSEINRVLKDQGILLITTPSKHSFIEKMRRDPQHLHLWSPKEFKLMLKNYGFQVEITKGIVFISYFLQNYLERSKLLYECISRVEDILSSLFFLKPIGWCFAVKARKIKRVERK